MESGMVRDGFAAAATYFVAAVDQVPTDGWDQPGLGEWPIRALVGHTTRALSVVETYLDAGAATVTIPDAVDYYRCVLDAGVDHTAIAERGRAAGQALGDNPAAAIQTLVARVVARVAASPDTALVGTPAGGMTLIAYLPTRVLELAIHALDLAVALGREGTLPESAARVTLDLVGTLAARRDRATDLLLAATGRRALPPGYTVL